MTSTPEQLTQQEVTELSAQLKLALRPIELDKPFEEHHTLATRRPKVWALSGVAASVVAIIAYAIVGQVAPTPAWSSTPITVDDARQRIILDSCENLLPPTAKNPKIHLLDFRGAYGDAVLVTTSINPPSSESWTCHFIKPQGAPFKAIAVNQAKYIFPEITYPNSAITAGGISIPVIESIVWRGGDLIDGVKIPASQIIMGTFTNGAYSVQVKCPSLPSATAALSSRSAGVFSIWIPSSSTQCQIFYFDKSGKPLNYSNVIKVVPSHTTFPNGTNSLTSRQYKFAQQIAQAEIKKEDATVSSVTAKLENGTVIDSNVGYSCTSGQLLKILLIGSFPHIVSLTAGLGAANYTVHGVALTADAKSGKACLLGVQVGRISPPSNSVLISW